MSKLKWLIHKIRINKGGYTDAGWYFGTGKPLYRYVDDEGLRISYIRANDRADAIKQVKAIHSDAKFHRE